MNTIVVNSQSLRWSRPLADRIGLSSKKISALHAISILPLLIERIRGARTIVIGPGRLQYIITIIAKILFFDVLWIGEGAHSKPKHKAVAPLSRFPRHIIAPNQASEAHFLHSGITSARVTVIYPPTEHTNKRARPSSEQLIIGCDGSIPIKEGLGSLLQSMALVRDIASSVKLIIGGSIRDIDRINWIARQLKLTNSIKLAPSQTDTWVSEANVYALPQCHDATPPLSLLSAMSLGQAIIATDQLSHREFIEQNKNGIVVEPNNPEMFSQAIINLARNPEWVAELGAENARFAEAHLTQEIFDKKLAFILQ